MTVHNAQMCNVVNSCFVAQDEKGLNDDFMQGGLLAIIDTACTKTVAGYPWFECFCRMCDALGMEVITYDHEEFFRFGASRIYTSAFGVAAWFAVQQRWFLVRVAIVPCAVPLLFSRPILAAMGMHYDVAGQKVCLERMGLSEVKLKTSPTHRPSCVDCE